MADFLASIFGTEKDKFARFAAVLLTATQSQLLVLLQDRCMPTRRPLLSSSQQADFQPGILSRSLISVNVTDNLPDELLPEPRQHTARYAIHVMIDSQHAGAAMSETQLQELFDDFYEDIYVEMYDKYGRVGFLRVNLVGYILGRGAARV
jgi:hypothetical protein